MTEVFLNYIWYKAWCRQNKFEPFGYALFLRRYYDRLETVCIDFAGSDVLPDYASITE